MEEKAGKTPVLAAMRRGGKVNTLPRDPPEEGGGKVNTLPLMVSFNTFIIGTLSHTERP